MAYCEPRLRSLLVPDRLDEGNPAHHCPRCGEPFPSIDDFEQMAEWVIIEDGAEIVCPGCATAIDKRKDQ